MCLPSYSLWVMSADLEIWAIYRLNVSGFARKKKKTFMHWLLKKKLSKYILMLLLYLFNKNASGNLILASRIFFIHWHFVASD